MKHYCSDEKFNVCIIDENKIKLVVMPCSNKDECDYYKKELNKVERNDRAKSENRYN